MYPCTESLQPRKKQQAGFKTSRHRQQLTHLKGDGVPGEKHQVLGVLKALDSTKTYPHNSQSLLADFSPNISRDFSSNSNGRTNQEGINMGGEGSEITVSTFFRV